MKIKKFNNHTLFIYIKSVGFPFIAFCNIPIILTRTTPIILKILGKYLYINLNVAYDCIHERDWFI